MLRAASSRLALARPRPFAVAAIRHKSTLDKLKELEAKADELLAIPNFPLTLKPFFQRIKKNRAEQEEWAAQYPEYAKAVEAKVAEIRAAGIPEDARVSKFEVGSLQHTLMKTACEADFIETKLVESGLNEITLDAPGKAEYLKKMNDMAVAKSYPAGMFSMSDVPDKMKIF